MNLRIPNFRYVVAFLLLLATMINYADRLAISVDPGLAGHGLRRLRLGRLVARAALAAATATAVAALARTLGATVP